MRIVRFTPTGVMLALLLAACAPLAGNASLGPNPGGGFYCPHNVYEGCVNP